MLELIATWTEVADGDPRDHQYSEDAAHIKLGTELITWLRGHGPAVVTHQGRREVAPEYPHAYPIMRTYAVSVTIEPQRW